MNDFHFLRPQFLFALLPLLGILIYLMRRLWQINDWSRVVDPQLMPYVLEPALKTKNLKIILLLALAWTVAIIACSGPTWKKTMQAAYGNVQSRVIAIDLSPTMLASDIPPSRMTRAKYKILELLNHIKQGQTGMVAFSDESYVVSPLTTDASTIALLVPELDPSIMPTQGSQISSGLFAASKLFQQANTPPGEIILITGSKASAEDISYAKKLNQQGVRISVLAMNSDLELKQLAHEGGGLFQFFTNNNEDIENLLKNSDDVLADPTKEQQLINWHDAGYYLLWLLLPFALFSFRRGWFERL